MISGQALRSIQPIKTNIIYLSLSRPAKLAQNALSIPNKQT